MTAKEARDKSLDNLWESLPERIRQEIFYAASQGKFKVQTGYEPMSLYKDNLKVLGYNVEEKYCDYIISW